MRYVHHKTRHQWTWQPLCGNKCKLRGLGHNFFALATSGSKSNHDFSQAWLTWTPADQHANWPQVKCKNNLTAHIVAEALLGGAQHRIGHLKANGLPHSATSVPTQGTRAQLKEGRDLEIKNFIEGGATLDDVRENYYSDYKAAPGFWKVECERHREKEALQSGGP